MKSRNHCCLPPHNGRNGSSAGQNILKPLAEFVRDKGRKAFNIAYKLSGDLDESRDLVQETCYRVLWNWKKYDARRPLDAWFFGILRNVFADSRRRHMKRTASLDALDDREDGCAIAHGGRSFGLQSEVLEHLERKELADTVRNAVKRLGPSQRRALTLRSFERRSYAEVAFAEGIPIGTVRSRLFRAREALRRDLLGMGVQP